MTQAFPSAVRRADGYVQAELRRDVAHPPTTVWAALTDPSRLPQWLAAGVVEPRVGGAARLDFVDSGIRIDSPVTAVEPERLLEYSWSSGAEPSRPLRWTLEPTDEGCRVRLSVGVPEPEDAARAFAGWDAHLEMLEAALEGVPIRFPFESFKAARERYRETMAA